MDKVKKDIALMIVLCFCGMAIGCKKMDDYEIHLDSFGKVVLLMNGNLYVRELDSQDDIDPGIDLPDSINVVSIADDNYYIDVVGSDGRVYSSFPFPQEVFYSEIESVMEEGGNIGQSHISPTAISRLSEINKVKKLWCKYGETYTAVLNDGTIEHDGDIIYDGGIKCVMIACEGRYGLLEDGTVWCGDYHPSGSYLMKYNDLRKWKNIKQIDGDDLLAAVTDKGKVLCESKELQVTVQEWINICKISYAYGNLVGLDYLGNVHVASQSGSLKKHFYGTEEWKDIVDIDTNAGNIVGLCSDGEIVIGRYNANG